MIFCIIPPTPDTMYLLNLQYLLIEHFLLSCLKVLHLFNLFSPLPWEHPPAMARTFSPGGGSIHQPAWKLQGPLLSGLGNRTSSPSHSGWRKSLSRRGSRGKKEVPPLGERSCDERVAICKPAPSPRDAEWALPNATAGARGLLRVTSRSRSNPSLPGDAFGYV